MYLELQPYRGFSATDIDYNCSATCDHFVQNGVVKCSNINISRVKLVLNESVNDIVGLCHSNNVNQWSNFSPLVKSVSGSNFNKTLVFTKPTVCSIGSFGGYNHNAPSPSIDTNNTSIYVNYGSQFTIMCNVNLGELQYFGAVGLALTLWEGATLVSYNITSIIYEKNEITADIQTPVVYSANNYTLKAYLVNSLTSFNIDGANIICTLPNSYPINIYASVIPETSFYVQNVADFTVNGAGFNRYDGRVYFTNAISYSDYEDLYIYIRMYNYVTGYDTVIDIYRGAYTSGTNFAGSSYYLGVHPIPATGVNINLTFDYY